MSDLGLQEKQSIAFMSMATEIFYGGAKGGGKSHLMRVIAIFFCNNVRGIQVYLFRRFVTDLYGNHLRGPSGFMALLAPYIAKGLVRYHGTDKCLIFKNGSRIYLCHCQTESSVDHYQGKEIHILMIDELTHFTREMYTILRTSVRMVGVKMPEKNKLAPWSYAQKLPLILLSGNPGGTGHNWVRSDFIKSAAPLQIRQMSDEEGGMKRQFISAKMQDNKILLKSDPNYASRLKGAGAPHLVKAMLEGDWDIVAGGALDDVWTDRLIVPRFKIPSSWYLDRSLDWGSAAPFSYAVWAESDGTEATLPDGSIFCPPANSLIRIQEWYGKKPNTQNEGLKLGSDEVAKGIIEIEEELLDEGWIVGKVNDGPADNSIGTDVDPSNPTIKDVMEAAGVTWTRSNKDPGTRTIRLQLIRDRMKEANKPVPEKPAIYFMNHCFAAIDTLPVLPRDKKKIEDVDTRAEDHVYDEVGYRVMASEPSVELLAEPQGW